MKSYLRFVVAACAAAFVTFSAFAADSAVTAPASSPAGTWKWTQSGRDGATWEQMLKLEHTDGKLSGTLLGGERPWGDAPDSPIADASFKDGAVAFTVTREFNGNQFVMKYEGKLDGDTIKGTVERPGRDGGAPQKRDWTASRVK